MGYVLAEGKFSATLSRHNSVKDEIHDALWQRFLDELDEIVGSGRYKSINLMYDANEEP